MLHDGDEKPVDSLSETDAIVERVLAALKWLIESCQRDGLGKYADFLEEAFSQCLQNYISEQREKLADSLQSDNSVADKILN